MKTIYGFSETDFENDDEKVRVYTGPPSYELLNFVLIQVSPHVSRRSQELIH